MIRLRGVRSFLLAVTVAVGCSFAGAQDRVLTPELILTIRTISDVQLSPDGNAIAFQVLRMTRDDEKPGPAIGEIWMTQARGGEPVRFTYNDKTDRAPQWSPDGKSLAFLSQRGESSLTQVFVIASTGGEAMQLTRGEGSVAAFKWSPDSRKIAYTMTDPKTKDELQAEREGKDWIVADQNYKHTRLYVADVRTADSKLVTRQSLTVHDFDWSPDGRQFILAATDTPLVDDAYMRVRLIVASVDGGDPRLLAPTHGKLTLPRWSPDGRWIAWLGATAMNDPFAGSVFVVSAGGGAPENLSRGHDGSANWLGWRPGSGSTLVFAAIERQTSALYSISLPDRAFQPLSNQAIIYGSGVSFSRDGRLLALAANTPKHPNEIFFGPAGAALTRLTRFNAQLDAVALGEQEVIRWKSVDGLDVEGVLVKPVGFQRGVRYPTVVSPHGGPEAADQNGWYGSYSRWGQMLAQRGYVTLYPNYRGSIGRGPEYAMADHRDLMGKEFQDIIAGIDYLVREGITDRDRVGIGGGSYGGYASAWATTFASERFRAAIVWMGITNWYSMTGTSDIFWENSLVHWDAIMYDNYDAYRERSPVFHIKKARTPTLIIHGAADRRVPPGQGQELYTALKWRGVPCEFVTYPREGHGIGERAHQLDFMKRVLGWFDRHLRNGGQ
ncbi:MAG TPA: S9 family peptidase [Blastocatellia bacterium]|nr:S9 family peptidase [Blastocatellia bacterium]